MWPQTLLLVSWLFIHHLNDVQGSTETVTHTTNTVQDANFDKVRHVHMVIGATGQAVGEAHAEHTGSDPDSFTGTTIHIHLQSPHSQYMEGLCESKQNEPQKKIGQVCGDQVRQLWQDLDSVKQLIQQTPSVKELQAHANTICPDSNSWLAFTNCYCSHCNTNTMEMPDASTWLAIWSHLPFCEHMIEEKNENLCEWAFHKQIQDAKEEFGGAGGGDVDHLDLNGMFRAAWNGEMEAIARTSGHMHAESKVTTSTTVTRLKRESVLKQKGVDTEGQKEDEKKTETDKGEENEKEKQNENEKKEEEEKEKEKEHGAAEEAKENKEEEEKRRMAAEPALKDNLSGTSFLSVHSVVLVWTIVLATGVTLVSFFLLLR